MVGYSLTGDGKLVNKNYHAFREMARTSTYSLDEWGDIDIEKYDLDTVDFDRSQKESTHITESMVDVEGGAQGGVNISKIPTLNYSRE